MPEPQTTDALWLVVARRDGTTSLTATYKERQVTIPLDYLDQRRQWAQSLLMSLLAYQGKDAKKFVRYCIQDNKDEVRLPVLCKDRIFERNSTITIYRPTADKLQNSFITTCGTQYLALSEDTHTLMLLDEHLNIAKLWQPFVRAGQPCFGEDQLKEAFMDVSSGLQDQ